MWEPFGPTVGLMAAAASVNLLDQIAKIAGTSFFQAAGLIPQVITRTHFGRVWLIRMSLIALLAIVFVLSGKKVSGEKRLEGRPALFLILGILLLISFTESASGHPADKGDFTFREINDWFHLMGAEAWGGGLRALSALVLPRIIIKNPDNAPESDANQVMVAGIARGFSVMAGFGVAVMAITGAANYGLYVRGARALIKTPYGLTVAAKIVLFCIILALGAFNRYVSVPELEQWAGCPSKKQGFTGRAAARFFHPFVKGLAGHRMAVLFKRLVRAEVFLVIVILFCAALLTHEMPASHYMHMKQGRGAMQNMDGM